jgi:hypothetical protein
MIYEYTSYNLENTNYDKYMSYKIQKNGYLITIFAYGKSFFCIIFFILYFIS